MDDKNIYIIGAGISGLIAAYELEKAGYKPIVFEKSDRVGGRVQTIEKNGFHLDIGFQVLLNAYPLAKEYLDMEALELNTLASGALIYVNDKSYEIGDPLRDFSKLIPTLVANVGSVSDKFKILKLNKLLKNKSIEDIFESKEITTLNYLKNFGFSINIIDRFFKPFFAGIFLETELRTSSRMFEFVYKMFGQGYATIPKAGIGAISNQLKIKLSKTEFRFHHIIKEVNNETIQLDSGDIIKHNGVILTGDASNLISNMDESVIWKSCMCLYFEVDQTNIPPKTIALIADKGKRSNNLYAYQDEITGKTILSVTSLQFNDKSDQEMQEIVLAEIEKYTGASNIRFIHSFRIEQALPDINNLRASTHPSESRLRENIFVAGDYLFNGSLNAAMESGKLAAKGLIANKG